jgi:hypothetical protein
MRTERQRSEDVVDVIDVAIERLTRKSRVLRVNGRARSSSTKRWSARALAADAEATLALRWIAAAERPKRYGDCETRGLGVVVPCPFVSCAYHLALDVNEKSGSIKFKWPAANDDDGDLDVSRMPATCALGVARVFADGMTLEAVASTANITRERARQIEERALDTLRATYTEDDL